MTKGLEALKDIREFIEQARTTHIITDGLKAIEKELKEKEKQDFVYNILKEVVQFNVLQPEIKETDNGYSFVSGIALKMQRELENKERQLFREWVLKECFPKEMEALEIIKKFVNIDMLMFKGELEQEEYDLLKEVLL